MSDNLRNDIAPDTLSIELDADGVAVEYTDGRSVFYHGVPQKAEGSVVSGPGKDVHVLVTDPTEEEGVVVYVNDRKTHDDILRDSGVGRVIVDRNVTESIFPGVEATNSGYRVEVTADPEAARGRVFVFVEDEMGEQSYEIVAPEGDADDPETETEA
ncbi:DUF5796 family protein [Salinirubellus salinus]|uniref:DUF5796 family protein n=1 Tax=Salinirubellus salinus TaxID=1364945 RepID=A0A9E7R586_9EURY|nr:DUF5796 family protein [Salinirubellus salinus]UWM56039.1 DUF5796 family protein [Salinirubellus salinus]